MAAGTTLVLRRGGDAAWRRVRERRGGMPTSRHRPVHQRNEFPFIGCTDALAGSLAPMNGCGGGGATHGARRHSRALVDHWLKTSHSPAGLVTKIRAWRALSSNWFPRPARGTSTRQPRTRRRPRPNSNCASTTRRCANTSSTVRAARSDHAECLCRHRQTPSSRRQHVSCQQPNGPVVQTESAVPPFLCAE